MAQIYFWLIVGFIIFSYLLSRLLDILNASKWSEILPTELECIYDAQKYKESQNYQKVKMKFSTFHETWTLIILLIMLFIGGFAYIDTFIRNFSEHPIIMALLFIGIIGLGAEILNLPFDIYFTFVIEEKFGFNKTTPLTFITDKIKEFLLAAIIGGSLLALITWMWMITGKWFWIVAWLIITVISVFFSMFYSNIIVPLFNKQTPLEEGELKQEIQNFTNKIGFKIKDIFVIDGSKRTSKANAYFTGLGHKKRIVLYDTLIKELSTNELIAVLAHEIGHYKKKHTLINLIVGILQTGLMLYILSLFLNSPDMSKALGANIPSFHVSILTFGLLYNPLSLIINLLINILSRKHEFAADYFAKINYDSEALQSALKKLSINNLSNLNPHPAYVFFYYSHPPLLERLKALKK